MITAVIIDDEAKGRIALHQKIKDYCPAIKVVAEAASGGEAIAIIDKFKPLLIFLDIEMPGMNGFEMLNRVTEKNFHVIFTTAYDQYAIKAIKYAAFDYLLKPVDVEELKQAVARVSEATRAELKKQVEVLRQNTDGRGKQMNKLAIPTLEGLLFIDIQTIVYLEASSNYTHLFLSDKTKLTASKTLKEFEDLLPAEFFFRPHHSYLINLNFIKKYIKGDGGQIELQTGAIVEVSRRKKESFLKLIGF